MGARFNKFIGLQVSIVWLLALIGVVAFIVLDLTPAQADVPVSVVTASLADALVVQEHPPTPAVWDVGSAAPIAPLPGAAGMGFSLLAALTLRRRRRLRGAQHTQVESRRSPRVSLMRPRLALSRR